MASINPIRYRGYYQDPETGWYYLKTRYYNPDWRRFINADSAFVAGGDVINGSNMFAYCNNNPVMYFDSEGESAKSALGKNIIGYTVWASAKILSAVLLPVSEAVKSTSDALLNEVKDDVANILDEEEQDSLAETNLGEAIVPLATPIINSVLPEIYGWLIELMPFLNKWTFDEPTGLRHLIPINMEFLAPWAAYGLGFKPSQYKSSVFKTYTNYTSSEGTTMWQSMVGYTPIYDLFFSLGGPIFKDKYEFEVYNNDNSVEKYYVIWIWKADYWNLGAGAEIGIYSTSSQDNKEQGFYEVDTNLKITANMKITYKYLGSISTTLNNFTQTNWWVCSFTPEVQLPNIAWLDVSLKVKFNNDSRWEAFYVSREEKFDTDEEWTEVSLADSKYKNKSVGHRTHKCGNSYPLACNCQYSCCENPCGYLSDNGYEFYINY